MADAAIFLPFFALMILTLVVWAVMYVRRTAYLVNNRVDLRKVDSPPKMEQNVPADVNLPAFALRNLFELPIIFYALCLYLFVNAAVDNLYLVAAWIFVGGRVVHSIVYCTTNKVLHRFWAYFVSALVLWAMVLRAGFGAMSSLAT